MKYYLGIHDRFIRDEKFRKNMIDNGRTEEICRAFNLHSIINSGLIPGGPNSSKRQTVFFLPVDPRDKSHKDLEKD